MEIRVTGEDADSYEEVMLIYQAALRQMETKLAVLNEEFRMVHKYNPIEHITSRVKKSESIAKKLRRHGYDVTLENMVKYCNDIAGVRVICSFTSDIYRIADMISNQSDIRVLAIKDYIASPKPSGYRSYHMIVMIPVYLSDRIIDTKAEIQIRTIAMDFWASLEHKIQYKFVGDAPEHITRELRECAEMVTALDERMLELNTEIQKYSAL
ncbi:MAG: GTP pyrophosphokinase family protein [Lachnospiraceae bacterium]|nr:GTP pyrophosphokinase family protein [Lachnospiraceae bacterium]